MQKKLLFLGLALSLFILNTMFVNADSVIDNPLLYEKTINQTIKRGLIYEKLERLTQAGWIEIHVLKMDRNSEFIEHFTDVEKLGTQVLADNMITLEMLNIEINEQSMLEKQDRQSRKGIGFTEDGEVLIALIVDENSHSIGITTDELKQLFLEFNVTEFNDFDDLGFISHSEIEPARKLVIEDNGLKTFVNSAIEIEVKAMDKYNQPVDIDDLEFAWGVSGISGSFNGKTFTPSTAGLGKITVYHGSIYQSVSIEVIDSIVDLAVETPILYLDSGETGSFSFVGTDVTGFSGSLHPSALTYSVSDMTIGSFTQGEFVSTDKTGITKVVARFGGRSISGYVVVGKDSQVLEEFRINPISIGTSSAETVTASIGATTEVMKDETESLRMSYSLEASNVEQTVTLYLTDVIIEQPAETLTLELFGNRRGHQLKVNLLDNQGKTYDIVMSEQVDWIGWRSISINLPANMMYPVTIVSLDIIASDNLAPLKTALFLDSLKVESYLDTSHIKLDAKPFIADPLMAIATPTEAYNISVFGPSRERYCLLDAIILDKAYKALGDAELSVFAGPASLETNRIANEHLIWPDAFTTKGTNDIKFITLGTGSGGLRTTDASQFQKLQETLTTTSQNNIVIIANRSPNSYKDFHDEREAAIVHELLKGYRQKTGKNIFYVNGNGKETHVTIKDHIRYMDLNGLSYEMSLSNTPSKGRLIDLNNSFYTLEFYVVNRQVTYRLNNLFPMVTY